MINIASTKGFRFLQECLWQDVRDDLHKVNPELAKIIDKISPDSSLPLIKVKYNYGDLLFKDGDFCLLDDIKQANCSESECNKILNYFGYAELPFTLILNKASEVFFETDDRVIPVVVLPAGSPIGLFELLNTFAGRKSYPYWSASAGSRSTFMLPKINNEINHKRLIRKFKINEPKPSDLASQWSVFREIARSKNCNSDWNMDVLFFTKPWIEKLQDQSDDWLRLRSYLFEKAWSFSDLQLNQTFATIWQRFSLLINKHRFKPRVYITDTLRHLFFLAYGAIPAFTPVTSDELLPTASLKQAYVDVYQLKDYAPTIFSAINISPSNPVVYYSLGYPTLIDGNPDVVKSRNSIADLREIKLLMERMLRYCAEDKISLQRFKEIISNFKFDYWHGSLDEYDEINNAELLPHEDSRFIERVNYPNNREFCSSGAFLNSCIRISRKF
ncbi:MAG: hypothetical protein JXR42_00450 [Gammaproteobacteria bacterium]|nr:hypothetical protein [Gammaproteobacteria bacterium]